MQVYKARWHGTLVAVRLLATESIASAKTALEAAAIVHTLRHPHVLTSLDYWQENGKVRKCDVLTPACTSSLHALVTRRLQL